MAYTLAIAVSVSEAPTRTTHWANVGEASFAFGTWILYFINRYLGRWPFRIVLAPVMLFYILRSGVARRASRDYFQRLGLQPSTLRTYKHLWCIAEKR